MMAPGCLGLILILALLLFFPLLLANVVLAAMAKLGLSPQASMLAAFGILIGGAINIPVKRIPRDQLIDVSPFPLYGIGRMVPQWVQRRSYTVIAVNVGGCIIPSLIAAYEIARLAEAGSVALFAVLAAAAVNIAVCYWLARPVPGVGIAMPALVPAAVAALCGLTFLPPEAPIVAFVSGVLGPLIGADLLHMGDVRRIAAGVASIGGAGTFDGIVLSGLVATLLA